MRIAIITNDTLRSVGLRHILADYFHSVELSTFPLFTSMPSGCNDTFDYYIIESEIFAINIDFFLPRRNRTIIITNEDAQCGSLSINTINNSLTQECIIERLAEIFETDRCDGVAADNSKELSAREADVLQLIVKGITNKEIADKLNISLNTVQTHRKNITSKLGIKTVSGLTFYALMNGIISGDEIEP